MERKKNPKADLESKKGIFVLIGLIISLSLSILAYESKSYDNLDAGFGDLTMDELFEDEIDITRPEPPPPPTTKYSTLNADVGVNVPSLVYFNTVYEPSVVTSPVAL